MSKSSGPAARMGWVVATVAGIVIIAAAGVWTFTELPQRWGWVQAKTVSNPRDDDHSGHDHDEHDHDHGVAGHEAHADHDEYNTIELSEQARGNLGLETQTVSTSTFTQYVTVPGRIVDWPGRTHISITAPLTGVVKAIYISRGELVSSGQPLFSLRLTHQDLVKTQSEFLTALGRLDVEQREIERLTAITESGAVARKALIEHEYEHERLLAELKAERQAMLLHGLTEQQISSIEENRKLVREVTIYAPTLHSDDSLHHDSEPSDLLLPPSAIPPISEIEPVGFTEQPDPNRSGHDHEHIDAEFLVTELKVNRGASVDAGESLGRLSDYSVVLIEGHAFQKDGAALRAASKYRLPLQAVIDSSQRRPEIIDDLKIAYIGSEVGLESRALPFYVPLENQVERSEQRDGQTYLSWRFKPGQRLQVRVPLEGYDDTIVVPKEAVAEEGAERYVFVDHGDHFDRRAVRVLARDELWVAIRNDGSLKPGQKIAVSGAHQLQMAMKNRGGGAVDPHAGHNH